MTAYFIKISLLGEKVDIFDTDPYYHAWILAIKDYTFSFDSVHDVYLDSLMYISAPEPVSSYITLAVHSALPSLTESSYIDVLNIVFIIIFITTLKKFHFPFLAKAFLVLALTFGYYEFTALHSTHRFKIALILVMISVLLYERRKHLSQHLMALAYLTHFSLFAMLPLLFLLNLSGFRGIEIPPVRHILLWGSGLVLAITSSLLYTSGDLEAFKTTSLLFINNKLGHTGLNTDSLIFIAIIGSVLWFIFNNFFVRFVKNTSIWLSVAYLAAALIIVGTSTLLYSYYMMLTPILIAAFRKETSAKKKVILLFIMPILFYSLFKGLILAPTPLLADILQNI